MAGVTAAYFDSGATFEVSIATSGNPTTEWVTLGWTDITAYVRDIQIRRGRSAETDSFQPGSCTVTLLNTDRRFDPDYASGPYYGSLVPGMPIRVRLTYATLTSYLYSGYISGFPQRWDVSDNVGEVTVTAYDWFKYAAQQRLPESAWAMRLARMRRVDAKTPWAWWRLGEADGATLAYDNSGNARHGTYVAGTLTDGLTYATADGARAIADGNAWDHDPILTSAATAWDAVTLNCWVRLPSVTTSGTTQWLWLQSADGPFTWANGSGPGESTPSIVTTIGLNYKLMWGLNSNTKTMSATLNFGSTDNTYTSSAITSAFDDGVHMLTLIRNTAGTVTFYLDGVSVGSSASTSGSINFGLSAAVGTFRGEAYTMDEFTVWNADMSSFLDVMYAAGATGATGSTYNSRLFTLGIGSSPYVNLAITTETGISTMVGVDTGGGSKTLLDLLQECEQSEQGRFFMAADQTLTAYNRRHDPLNKTVAIAFSDAAGSTYPYAELEYEYDDSRVFAGVDVTTGYGTTSSVASSTGGGQTTSISTAVDTDEQARYIADAFYYAHQTAKKRLRAVTVKPRKAPATLIPAVRTTEIGARITVRRLPLGIGSAWTQSLTVEGIEHSIALSGEWTTKYLTAPTDATDTWAILDDASYGILDTNRLGY